jgi:hypothetical protein
LSSILFFYGRFFKKNKTVFINKKSLSVILPFLCLVQIFSILFNYGWDQSFIIQFLFDSNVYSIGGKNIVFNILKSIEKFEMLAFLVYFVIIYYFFITTFRTMLRDNKP